MAVKPGRVAATGTMEILRWRFALWLLPGAVILWAATGLFCKTPAWAGQPVVHHRLAVRLLPAERRLAGTDRITLPSGRSRPLVFFLNPGVAIESVRMAGQPARYRFQNGRLRIFPAKSAQGSGLEVTIRYQGVFDDTVPRRPLNAENPGYGVSGTISENGTFLLAGAHWYPVLAGCRSTFEVAVTAPAGVVAVTAGSDRGRKTIGTATVSAWSVDHPVNGLSLSAARYLVHRRRAGRVTAMTFMLPSTDSLSGAYLDAVLRYIAEDEALFGPYPFSKFAVVENFFPTGYGFPSYTLLGSRVIRLPFIIHTSLGHEITHCWWGNGVTVSDHGGNWSEGLTTYVADYRFQAQKSRAAAQAYRLGMLRDYATLVTPATDFPLAHFTSRRDPASQVIGYDKGAMVFHMLAKTIGKSAFRQGLRDVFRQRVFTPTSWDDFRQAFEKSAQRPLGRFFDQWLNRTGAPRLRLEKVTAEPTAGGWRVKGRVLQQPPVYDLRLTLRLGTRGQVQDTVLRLTTAAVDFDLFTRRTPERLSLDPDFDVFRALYPEEIPPAVNSLKGSPALLVLLARDLPPAFREAATLLVRSLGVKRFRLVENTGRLDARTLKKKDLLLIGWPQRPVLAAALPPAVSLQRGGFRLNGRLYNQPGDAFFGVFTNPLAPSRVMAVFFPLSGTDAAAVARKITHYGRYSYLAFRRGRNRDRGTWPPAASPLVYDFPRAGR